jgi:acyl-coenzyme A thioesterase PaaI-like protein
VTFADAVAAGAPSAGPDGATCYDVTLDPGWSIGDKPNGGYLMAVVANAAVHAVERAHPLATSAHFLRPPAAGPAQVRVEVVKTGRTAAAARAVLWQSGRACLDVLVTAGDLPTDDPAYDAAAAPALPPPQECVGRPADVGDIPLLDNVDVRLDSATPPVPGGDPVIRGWTRLADGTAPDALALLLAVDVCPPTVFRLGAYGWAPTVELTTLVRALPAPGWLAFEARATHVRGGWFDEEARVWDSRGQLVAQSRQLALAGRG